MLPLMGLKLRRQEVKMITLRKQKGYTYRSRRTKEDHILIDPLPHLHALEEFLGVFSNVRYEPTVSLTQSLPGSAYERQFLTIQRCQMFHRAQKKHAAPFCCNFLGRQEEISHIPVNIVWFVGVHSRRVV